MTTQEELAALKVKLNDLRQSLDRMSKSEESSAKRDALDAVCGDSKDRAMNEAGARRHLLQAELYDSVRKMIP